MIINQKETSEYIIKWIFDYITSAKLDTLVVGLSGGIDSALVALLCKATKLPVVCANIPCHSSSSAFERADAFAQEHDLKLIKINLDDIHELITSQAPVVPTLSFTNEHSKQALSALRSCLRAPVLSYIATATHGLIVGTGNRSEDRITRYFQKFGDGCVDICPISDLFKSEVYVLFKALTSNNEKNKMGPASKAIYEAGPSADLWGPDAGQTDEGELGITYNEIEWADREDTCSSIMPRNGIIFNDKDPQSNYRWNSYSTRQKEIIEKLWKIEKISRHKYNPILPICIIRNQIHLVK